MGELDAVAFEYEDERALRQEFWRIQPGDIVIDVGCGYGSYTVPALYAGATVCAIDANERVLDLLVEMAEGSENLVPLYLAIYDGNPYPDDLMGQIEDQAFCQRDQNEVRWTTVDTVVCEQGLPRVDWIKIDVEGGEAGVLRGALQTLWKWRPRLLIEDHTSIYPWVAENESTKRILRLLDGLNYQIETVPYVGLGPDREYLVCSCAT